TTREESLRIPRADYNKEEEPRERKNEEEAKPQSIEATLIEILRRLENLE
ncbi:3225_t:CDS:1, partial [Ambispora leptoticha]